MIADFHIGGVFIPGLVMIAILALGATVAILRILSATDIYRLLPSRPLVEVSVFVLTFGLLIVTLPHSTTLR